MATSKPRRTPEEIEDVILRKIFLVSLTDSLGNDSPVVYLELTAAEILSEGKELRLNRDVMERVLIDHLSGAVGHPFQYLVDCYRRACDEGRKITAMKDKNVRSEIELAVEQAKKLAVGYCRIHLGNPGMFPNRDTSNTNSSPLLPLVFSEVASSVDRYGDTSSSNLSPPGFIKEFFREGDYDSMEPILKQLYKDLRSSVLKVSALGNFQQPLRALINLINSPVGAKALVNHPRWIPNTNLNGRVIEMSSIIGAFFHVSALPDPTIFKSQPDVGQLCFAEPSTLRPADRTSSFMTINTVMNNLHDGLTEVLRCLLKKTGTREAVLQYLAEVINRNASRAYIQVHPMSCASSGMFVNLSAVMVQLCQPFLDGSLENMDKIDPRYVFNSTRLELRKLTVLHPSSEEVSEWISGNTGEKRLRLSLEATSSGNSDAACTENVKYSFTCECFFMTARVLNLGLLKAYSDFKHLAQEISRAGDALSTMKMQGQGPPQLQQAIAQLETKIELLSQEKLCYDAQILGDGRLIQRALSFYRLMVVWLAGLVGGCKMPLPSSCPMHFAAMPEHFVDDAMELLIFASTIPRALDGVVLVDFMNFIIMFMASPKFIKNPYLRAKMVEVLNCWMRHRSRSGLSALDTLVEGHQLALEYLVRNLLKLYIEIENTGSDTQFYDKFNIRHNIAELLKYLWKVPSHQNAWIQIAKKEEKGEYLKFLNFLINDCIYLLDESLTKIPELKVLKAEMSNTVEWEQRTAQERLQSTRQFQFLEKIIRMNMRFANENVSILSFTSEQIKAPFLLPEMVERVASMLNYFLLQIVGPERKSLILKDPEKIEFQLDELLKQIVNIYVNLAKGDTENIFAIAITKDERFTMSSCSVLQLMILGKLMKTAGSYMNFRTLVQKLKLQQKRRGMLKQPSERYLPNSSIQFNAI